MNFQDVIMSLEKFWAQKGCVVAQPYDMEVGAGTFHPTTLLKALGPEPWRKPKPASALLPVSGDFEAFSL
jgi:glycyl-tRNA synthetase alpha chain